MVRFVTKNDQPEGADFDAIEQSFEQCPHQRCLVGLLTDPQTVARTEQTAQQAEYDDGGPVNCVDQSPGIPSWVVQEVDQRCHTYRDHDRAHCDG